MGELQLIQPDVNGGRGGVRRRAILGEERALAGLAVLFIEDGDGLQPGGVLGVSRISSQPVPKFYEASNTCSGQSLSLAASTVGDPQSLGDRLEALSYWRQGRSPSFFSVLFRLEPSRSRYRAVRVTVTDTYAACGMTNFFTSTATDFGRKSSRTIAAMSTASVSINCQ